MSWVAVGGIAVSAVGAGLQSSSANKAAKAQQGAADAATSLQRDQYDQTAARNQPFVQGGTSAYNALLGRLGLAGTNGTSEGYGTLGRAPTSQEVMDTPGYQFGLDQGNNLLQRQLNAKGQSYSGAALKAAARYGTDYATTKYDDSFNRLQSGNQQAYNQLIGAAQLGQASANNTAAAGAQFGTQAGNNIMGAGNAQGAGDLAQGNIWSNMLNQGVSAYKNAGGSSSSGGFASSPGVGSPGAGGSPDGYWADGGPVRAEPRIGTRSPLPGASTGGGMSREALMAALLAQEQRMTPQRSGMAALPANPLMNPRAIIDTQAANAGAYAGGGAVYGPGGPREDAIDAHLSDGEHVVDTAAVTGLGNGSNERGQAKLNMLRKKWKGR